MNRPRAMMWINDGLDYGRIYASLDLDEQAISDARGPSQ